MHVTRHDSASEPTSPPRVLRLFGDTLTLLSASKRRVTAWINSGHLQLLRRSPSGISARFLFKERGIKRAIPHLATAPGTNRRFFPVARRFPEQSCQAVIKNLIPSMRPGAFSLTFQKRREKSYCDAVRVYALPLSLSTPLVLVNFECFLSKLRGCPIWSMFEIWSAYSSSS